MAGKSFNRRWKHNPTRQPIRRRKLTTEALERRIVLSATIGNNTAVGSEMQNFRLAIAATAEYTALMGGQAQALTAIETFVDQVNEIFEPELSIHFDLVSGTNTIFTDSSTDGYTNGNVGDMLNQNTAILDGILGNSGYDIGHVFGSAMSGGQGLATLGSAGNGSFKGRGASISSNPQGPSWVNLVAHEFGHQFDANHTFNANAFGSTSGSRNAANAYEPASGSTLMSYAGIAGDSSGNDNLQSSPDSYFHAASFEDIQQHIASVATPFSTTPISNGVPTIDGGADYTIPAGTPFQLTAAGSDADAGDTLTYTWEQLDLGPAMSLPITDNGSSPLFRSFLPSESPTRVFPRLSDLADNVNTAAIGEALPTTTRDLNFRASVRDSQGGVNSDDVLISVVDTGTPFAITSPNTAVNWSGGTSQTIVWSVAGTNAGSINVATVGIDLSLDGGVTYPFVLDPATPNDGSYTLNVPNIDATEARLRVRANGNVFFDISDANFTITANAGGAGISISESDGSTSVSEDGVIGGAGSDSYTLALNTPPSGSVEITVVADGQTEVSLDGVAFASSVVINKSDISSSTVFIRGLDDTLAEGIHSGAITQSVTASSDPNYPVGTLINPVSVSIADDELQPVIGVDFDRENQTSPQNWTRLSEVFGGTTSDLIREDGLITGVGLVLEVEGSTGLNLSSPSNVPFHSPSLAGIDGNHLAAESLTLTWTGLNAGEDYNLYLLETENFSDSVQQQLVINGAVYPAPFTQDTSAIGNGLLVNSGLADSAKPLESDAVIAQADANGEIRIAVTGIADSFAMLAGAAIQQVGPDVAGFSVIQSGGSTQVSENGTTDTIDVVLKTPPTGTVVIDISSSDNGEAITSPNALSFNSSNWNIPQAVTVTGVDDSDGDGPTSLTLLFAIDTGLTTDPVYDLVGDRMLDALNQDNEFLPLIGVDFEWNSQPNFSPQNWNLVDAPFFGPYENLVNESGNSTSIDLDVTFPGSGGVAAYDSSAISTLPDHSPSLAELSGGWYRNEGMTLTWSDLTPNTEFNVWLFAAWPYANPTAQTVTISGAAAGQSPFSMPHAPGVLLVNDSAADPARMLVDDAVHATSDSFGEIQITVFADAGGQYAVLSGAAIQEIAAAPPVTANLSVTSNGSESGPEHIVYTVTLDQPNTSGSAITFDLDDLGTGTATAGSDYTAIAGSAQISVANGQTSGSLTVTVIDDGDEESIETVDVQISNPSDAAIALGVTTASASILDNDGRPALTVQIADSEFSEADGDAATTVTITRNTDTSAALDVVLTSSDGSEAVVQTSATIPAGQASVTVDIDAVDDSAADGTQTVTITASALGGSISYGVAEPDDTFGFFGQVPLQLETLYQPPQAAIAVLPDGKVLAASEGANSNEIRLSRTLADGTLDTAFGPNGLLHRVIGANNPIPTAMVVQPDGKILVGGVFASGVLASFLVRLNPNGSLDTSYGNSGLALIDSAGSLAIEALDVTPDGKVVAAVSSTNSNLFGVMRVNADGRLDLSFGQNAVADYAHLSADAVDLKSLPDGDVLLLGNSGFDATILRMQSDGSLDPNFGNQGVTSVYHPTAEITFEAMQLAADGSIVMAGTALENFQRDFVVVRLSADGSTDTNFAVDGFAFADIDGSPWDYVSSLQIQVDGKIVAIGHTDGFSSDELALARFNVDGSLDNSFFGDGTYTRGFGTSTDQRALGSALDASGRLHLLAGNDSDIRIFALALGVIPFSGSDDVDVSDDDGSSTLDFGDAPSAAQSGFAFSYPVVGTASHNLSAGGPTLGPLAEADVAGVNSAGAVFDDNNGSDDEDGVVFVGQLVASGTQSSTASVVVELQNANPSSNRLDAWIDFNRDGDWVDAGEQIFANFDLGTANGQQILDFTIPQDLGPNIVSGDTYARFRVSSAGGLGVTGAASDGEIEDHAVTLVSADPFVVDTLTDESDGDYSPGDFSLREAIELANARVGADEIQFSPSLSGGTITLTLDQLLVNDDLSIIGPGAADLTISGNNAFRVLDLQLAPDVTLQGLTIADGLTAVPGQAGGGIRSTGNLEVRESVITGNATIGGSADGGGIYQVGGSLTVIDSVVSNNSTTGQSSFGGGISANSGSVELVRSTIEGNSIDAGTNVGVGGGVVVIFGDATIEQSTIANNVNLGVGSVGGGLVVSAGSLNLVDSTVSNNSSTGSGGGVYFGANPQTATISNSTISGNSAVDGDGGGLLIYQGAVSILHSTVTANSAPQGRGSGVASYSDGTAISDTVLISTIVAGNANSDVDNIIVGGGAATISSGDFNLIGDGNAASAFIGGSDQTAVSDPGLAALADNGGPTQTHALQTGSPAIDAGDTTATLSLDQRGPGFPRLVGSRVDIGAFELEQDAQLSIAATDAVKLEGNAGTTAFTFTVTRTGDTNGADNVAYSVTGTGGDPADADDFGGSLPTGVVNFADGESSQIITIDVSGDILVESDEGFTVTLSDPSVDAVITNAMAEGLIENDDVAPNVGPVVDLPSPPLIVNEGDAPLLVDPLATVTDVDSIDLDGGSLTVDWVTGAAIGEQLSIRNQGTAAGEIGVSGSSVTFGGTMIGTVSGGIDGAALVVDLNAAASQPAVQALVRNLTYQNTASNPTLLPRQIAVIVDDGDGGVSRTVNQQVQFGFAFGLGGIGYDQASSIDIDSQGNVYVTGFFQQTVDFDPGPGVVERTSVIASRDDIFVASYDPDGSLRWVHRFGNNQNDKGHAISVDEEGNVYVVGTFAETIDFDPGPGTANLTAIGVDEGFVLKLDSDGQFLNAGSIGGIPYNVLAESGDVFVTGPFGGTQDFDPGPGQTTLTSTTGAVDSFVLKLDDQLNFGWAKSIRTVSGRGAWANGIATDSTGNVFVVGDMNGTIDMDPGAGETTLSTATTNAFDLDIYVLKLDSNGDFQWARHWGENEFDTGQDIAVDDSGNVYTTGYYKLTGGGLVDFDPGPGVTQLTNAGGWDAFVSKLDSSGNFLWAHGVGTSGVDQGRGIDIDTNQNVHLGIQFAGTVDFDPSEGIVSRTPNGVFDAAIWGLNPNGDFLHATAFGHASDSNTPFAVVVDDQMNVYSAGQFTGSGDYDPTAGTENLVNQGGTDGFLTRFQLSNALQSVQLIAAPELDFGDAPSAPQSGFASSYPVTLAEDGARHSTSPTGPRLGPNLDTESDAVASALADADDLTGANDDEDGVTFTTALFTSATASSTGMVGVNLQNADSASNRLDAWIDFNRDGDWDDSGEQIFNSFDLGTANGFQSLPFTVPQDTGSNVVSGTTFARFRLSTAGGLSVTGAAPDGEVEDHLVRLVGADPFVVDTLVDESDGDYSSGDFSLREAIELANDRPGLDAIEFSPALLGQTIVLGGTHLNITGDLNLSGPGASQLTLSGSAGQRVLRVGGGADVVIDGLTISDGNLSGQHGGGIFSQGNLELRNSVVTANQITDGLGGGIYQSGGSLTLVDSVVFDNSVSGNLFSGGGIMAVNSDVTILSSLIDGNQTAGSSIGGGGISTHRGSLVITNSTISNNSNTGMSTDGGGILVKRGDLEISGSTVSSNSTGLSGGGVLFESGGDSVSAIVRNSTLSGNQAGLGGGIANQGGTVTIEQSTITANVSGTGAGLVMPTFGDPGTTILYGTILSGNIGPDVERFSGTFGHALNSLGFNLIGTGNTLESFDQSSDQTGVTDPGLAPLADNGGPTFTHALLSNSPGRDAAATSSPLSFDQRGQGFQRQVGSRVDIGAFEIQPTVVTVSVSPDEIDENATGLFVFTFTRSNTDAYSPALTVPFSHVGSATSGLDYVASQYDSIEFPVGESTVTVTVDPTADAVVEPDETVELAIEPGSGYIVGVESSATGIIRNDDTAGPTPHVEQVVYFNQDPDDEMNFSLDASGQRSIIRRIQVVFSGPVSVPLGAVNDDSFLVESIEGQTTGTRVGLEVIQSELVAGKQIVVLKFTGKDLIESVSRKKQGEQAMLIDGQYRFTIDGAKLNLDANGSDFGVAAVDDFFRLFGDADGDGDVDSTDNQQFMDFYTQGDFNSIFDFDANERNRSKDRTEFLKRLGAR
ncbi:M12 family metallo-peptidase [Stieleria sp. TO1_6]|uniref:choice-of-anchor Q domain-containing protein n=1 Tax=Stieleria tagensis TaxID=2956795 RepID=UPI00209AA8C2|nr:choice-of-anchor Q domain-containing protein [Stieleria tagensis]MCO8121088.1 M12 family metallo-peptidase [Stieleria tagensis]